MADTPAAELPEEAPRPRRRRPVLLLWGVLAVLAVGVGAVVVLAGDDDPPRLPIALGAGGGPADARAEADTASAGDAAMSMMAWVRYVAGDDLPALGGDGPAHRLANTVDRDRLREVADAFGLEGEIREQPDSGGSWLLEASDGSQLGAGPFGGGMWWYTSGALLVDQRSAGSGGSAGSGTSSSPDCPEIDSKTCEEIAVREREAAAVSGEEPPQCAADATECSTSPVPAPEPVTPPEDLPTKDAAEDIALDLFRRLGVDVDGAKVSVEGPFDAWYVSIEPLVDDLVVSGYVLNAAVGSDGEIVTAGGVLNRPERLGDYPTVDTRAAIDRLNEQSAVGFGDGREPAIAQDLATADVDCAATTGVPEPATDPATNIAVDPVCEPEVPAEPTEVVLHEAERILVLVSGFEADDPESYLVPGYRFRTDEQGWVDVISVDDESLLPQPPAEEPAPEPGDDPGAGDGTPGCAPVEPGPDGAVPDICLDPGTVDPGPATTAAQSGGDPDRPVESPVGEP